MLKNCCWLQGSQLQSYKLWLFESHFETRTCSLYLFPDFFISSASIYLKNLATIIKLSSLSDVEHFLPFLSSNYSKFIPNL